MEPDGGAKEDRTPDLLRARQALSQLSYGPIRLRPRFLKCFTFRALVGLGGVEPPTSPLSGVRSNQLSYRPRCVFNRNNWLWIRASRSFLCKEVIQPQVPLGLPCYDFTPVMNHKVVSALPKVKLPTSFATHSHGVTGGVYKARERIHRGILIRDY